jgi:hypothetical protein
MPGFAMIGGQFHVGESFCVVFFGVEVFSASVQGIPFIVAPFASFPRLSRSSLVLWLWICVITIGRYMGDHI